MIDLIALTQRPRPELPDSRPESEARRAAQEFEVSFLEEMLKTAGFGKSRGSFGGGVGEDAFADFLVRHTARDMVENGGIGLAELVFQALRSEQEGDANG